MPARAADGKAANDCAIQCRHPDHDFRRLRLSRPPCRARAGEARIPHPGRGAPAHLAGHLQPLGGSARFMRCRPMCATGLRWRPPCAAATWSSTSWAFCSSPAASASRPCKLFGAELVALAAAAENAQMIHVSAIGADEHSPSAYARSKAEGERLVLAATPEATIFAPPSCSGPRRFLQPLRSVGADIPGAAADRRRDDAVSAGLCGRCRRGSGQGGRG